MAIISTTIILATLQLYGCQPLLPPANVLSKGLPENEPILYINNVNSIYQRKMIEFATNHVNGRVACDSITRNQMAGLANFTFYVTHIVRYYPLGKDQSRIEYEFFLIHLPGVSGGFEEQAETRTRDLILEAIYNSTITYTNGESYVLSRTDS